MRRRTFLLRLGAASAGTLAFGACDGKLYTEGPRPRPAPGDDGGQVSLLDGGATPRDAGSAPPQPHDAGSVAPDPVDAGPLPDAGAPPSPDAGPCPGGAPRTVTLHDTYAQSLYFDGTYGPHTGVIRVEDVVAGATLDLAFWHGHGGTRHRFTVGAADLAALARGERVTLETTEVEGHSHMLFIDPVDEQWRVEGASDQTVTLC